MAAGFVGLSALRQDADLRAFQQARALLAARAVAWVRAKEVSRPGAGENGLAQRFVRAATGKVEGLAEAMVLEGRTVVVHSDAPQVARPLRLDSLEDKALYDTAKQLRANVRKGGQSEVRDAAFRRKVYPDFKIRAQADGVIDVMVAVKDRDAFHSAARVAVVPRTVTPFALPWSLLAVALGAAGLMVGAGRFVRRGWAVLFGAGLVVVVAGFSVDALVDARDQLRRTLAGASATTVSSLAGAGLFDGAADGAAFVDYLAETGGDGFGRALVSIRSAASSPSESVAGVQFRRGPYNVDYSPEVFAERRAVDAAELTGWGAGIGFLGVLIFVLGAFGWLQRGVAGVVRHALAYAYLSPAMSGLLVLALIPVGFGITLSFFARNFNAWEFVALGNYASILSDFDLTDSRSFYFKTGVTVMWTLTNVFLHVSIGLLLALLLNDQMLKARGIFRVILIVPWAVPNYITALIWKGMFHRQFGAVNFFLESLGAEPVAWFQEFWPAFFTNLATNTWLGFPFMMVVCLGALQSIPTDLYEAAFVDGASRFQRFSRITLPLLMPALVPAVIVGTIWTFNMFNIIYLVSEGNPAGATDILITDAFRWAFERNKWGFAAAYSTIIFLMLLAFTVITNRITGATKGAFE